MNRKEIDLFIEKIKEKILTDDKIVAMLLFGSYLNSENFRDVDICLIPYPNVDFGLHIIDYISQFPEIFDFSNYFSLPLYIRQNAQKGKLIIYKDYQTIFDIFMKTIKDWDLFKPHFETYLEALKDGK